MAEQATPSVISFGRAGMVAHENRWLSSADELVVAENVTFENDYAQKEPAASQYDPTGLALESPNGTFSTGGVDSRLAAIWLPALPTAAFSVSVVAAVAATTSPWVVTVTSTAVAGTVAVLGIGQTLNQNDNPIATSITDSKGNVWTLQKNAIGGASVAAVEIWTSLLTASLVGGVDTVTLVFTHATSDNRALAIGTYTGLLTATSEVNTTGGGTGAAIFTSVAYEGRTFPAMAIAALEFPRNNSVTATWLSGWTQAIVASSAGVVSQQNQAYRFVAFAPAIIAIADFKADASSAPAGTVSTTQNSTTVTGVGTSFLGTYRPGDEIQAGGETQVVLSITSNTVLDTIARWVTTSVGVAHTRRSGPVVITASLAGTLAKELPTAFGPGAGGLTGNLDQTILKSGLTTSRHRGRFVQGGKEVAANLRKLFYFNGVDPVQVLAGDATTTTNLATPPADWDTVTNPGKQPVNGLIHRGRLVGFGNLNDPHRIYFSDTASHEVFTGANAFQISLASNIGERLYGAADYQGVAFFWKYPAGIFYLDDTDIDFANWAYRTRSESLGVCASPHAALPTDDDVMFCTPDGHFHLLSAVNSLGGQRSSDLTRMLGLQTWTKNNVDTTRLDQLCSVWNPVTKQALFGVKALTNPTAVSNDLLLRWDFGLADRGGPPRFSYATAWAPNALALKRRGFIGTQSVMIGETANVMYVDPNAYGYRVDNLVTNGISQTVQTPALDFAEQDAANRTRKKSFRSIELIQKGTALATQTLTLTAYVDTIQRQSTQITFTQRRARFDLNVGDGWDIAIQLSVPPTSTVDVGNLGLIIWYIPTGQDHSRAS